jgi:hypothetical protein
MRCFATHEQGLPKRRFVIEEVFVSELLDM